MRNRRGAILIDLLITICIVMILIPVTMACISSMKDANRFDPLLQDEIALFQLRKRLILAYDIQYQQKEIRYVYQGREERLSKVNQNLIVQPGTLIFLSQIDDCCFKEENGAVFVVYERDGKSFSKILVHE